MNFKFKEFIETYTTDPEHRSFVDQLLDILPYEGNFTIKDENGDPWEMTAEQILVLRQTVLFLRQEEEIGGN